MNTHEAAQMPIKSARLTGYVAISASALAAGTSMAEVQHIPSDGLPFEFPPVKEQRLHLYLADPNGIERDLRFEYATQYGGTYLAAGRAQIVVASVGAAQGAISVGPGTLINQETGQQPFTFWSSGSLLVRNSFTDDQRFLPLRIVLDGGVVHFGWVQIKLMPDGSLRLTDAAWNSEAGAPITTPESLDDAALGALAAGEETTELLRRGD